MQYILDGHAFTDKEVAYQYLIEQLELPDYTGHNLDGLWDVLTDLDDVEIILVNARLLLDQMEDNGRQILDLLGDLNFEEQISVNFYW